MTTKVPCKIIIPARFIERGLGTLEPEVYSVTVFAMVMEDAYYSISTVPAMMRLLPSDINRFEYDSVQYLSLEFPKGSMVSPQLNVVVRDTLVYYIYNELVAKGNVPWYLNLQDLGKLFEKAPQFAGVSVGANHAIWEMIVSSLARTEEDKAIYYRHVVKTVKDLEKPPVIVPQRSIIHGPTSTVARLIGAYFKEGVTASLVNPSEKVEPIEDLLRR